jgi:hypothetical protein
MQIARNDANDQRRLDAFTQHDEKWNQQIYDPHKKTAARSAVAL